MNEDDHNRLIIMRIRNFDLNLNNDMVLCYTHILIFMNNMGEMFICILCSGGNHFYRDIDG